MPTANLSSYYLMSLPLEHKDIKKVQLYSKYTKKKKSLPRNQHHQIQHRIHFIGYNNRFVEKCGHLKGQKTHKT